MSDLEQFAQDLHQEVLVKCADDASPQMREDAFTECVLERLTEHNEADNADSLPCLRWESRGRLPAAKINAWGLSGDDAMLDLFVSLYHGTGEVESVGLPETRKQFKLLHGFLMRAREGFHTQLEESHEAFVAAQRIHAAKDSLTTVRLFFLTDGVAPRAEDIEQEPMDGVKLRYVLWDLNKLSQLHVGHREVIELDFAKDYDGSIPCIEKTDATKEYRTFLTFMPGQMVARIYGEHGQRLLERNVRAFLQAKGKVNKGLQQTLREAPHRFLAYNNGLCCTAAEVRLEKGKDGQLGLAWAKDFQIVNGGQTTASIYHAQKKEHTDISSVVVQVKLTVLKDPTKMTEIVPLISRYANSQNKVNAADFSANGPFHHRLEELSRTVWAPAASGLERGTHWYYERARGSYLDDKAQQGTPARKRDWEKMNPPHQKFTKTDLAKFEHAWLGLPHLVCLGAEKNFIKCAERMEDDGEPIVDLNYFHHMVAKAILWRSAEKLFDTLDLEGYRANSVAYALSWLAERSRRRTDLNRIWAEQCLSPVLCDVVKEVCKAAWEHLEHQGGNIGEASKKSEVWEAFQKVNIKLGSQWENELAKHAFVAPKSDDEALAVEWEKVRQEFVNETRTMGQVELYTGKEWVPSKRRDPASLYANLTWDKLCLKTGFGAKKRRWLVEMFSAAVAKDAAKWKVES